MSRKTFVVFLSYVLWAILPLYWKLMGDLTPVYVLCTRTVFMVLVLTAAVTLMRRWRTVKAVFANRKQLLLTFLAGLLICYNAGIYIYLTSAGQMLQSSLGYYTMPLMMVLMGALVFKEKLSLLEKLAVFSAAAGVVYIFAATGVFPLLALSMPLSFALYGTLKKYVGLEANVSLFIEPLPLFPIALGLMIYFELTGAGATAVYTSPWQWLLLPGCGLAVFMPMVLFGYGITGTSFALNGMLQYVTPTIQFLQLIMFAFVWAGVILYIAAQRRKIAASKKLAEKACAL